MRRRARRIHLAPGDQAEVVCELLPHDAAIGIRGIAAPPLDPLDKRLGRGRQPQPDEISPERARYCLDRGSLFRLGEDRIDNHRLARDMWDWKMGLYQRWAQIRVISVEAPQAEGLLVGKDLKLKARVHLGPVPPDSVQVQAYTGSISDRGHVELGRALPLDFNGNGSSPGVYDYEGTIPCELSGRFGYEIRVIPHNPHLISPFVPSLITWG